MKVALFAVLTALAGFSLTYWRWAQPTLDPAAGSYPESRDARPGVQGIGFVEPVGEVRKLSLRTGGVVRRCAVEVGQHVKKGDVLVELESATQKSELDQAKARLQLAEAEAAHAKAGVNPYQIQAVEQMLERLKEKAKFARSEADRSGLLTGTHSTSPQEHRALESRAIQAAMELKEKEAELLSLRRSVTDEQRAMLDARVRLAEAEVRLAQERLNETTLAAPFDGVVLKVLKREGEGVRASDADPVVLLGRAAPLMVRAEIDERHVRKVRVGQPVEVFGRTLQGQRYRGVVVSLEPMMGDKSLFARTSAERKDLDVQQILIRMDLAFDAPVGLQVDVRIDAHSDD